MDEPSTVSGVGQPATRPPSRFQQPSAEQIADFRAGDPVAIDAAIRIVLPQLARWATRRYSSIPAEDVLDVVYQVLSETCQHHDRYDPARGAFTSYIIGLLEHRLGDAYRTWSTIGAHEESGPHADEAVLHVPGDIEGSLDRDVSIVRAEFLDRVAAELGEVERDLWALMLEGNKDTAAAAAILARQGPVVDRQREVKNAKARLMRKVRAIAEALGYRLEDLV